MARARQRSDELPPPLPPETRTVGQLVAESIRLYGRRFFPALSLGVAPAVVDVVASELPRLGQLAFVPLAGAVLLTGSYIGAVVLAAEIRPDRRALGTGFAAGALVFLPFPFLTILFVLPGLAWFAFVGLVVPVALVERLGLRDSFRRALALGRVDYVHMLGGLATLVIVVFLSQTALFFLLRGVGEATAIAAKVLADLVITPLLFLGAALLYFDQEARLRALGSPRQRPRRRRDADVHHADDPHRPGRADPQVEPGPAP